MRVVDIIEKKRQGVEHSAAEIDFLVAGYSRGDVPDYQMSAWLMAVIWRGLTDAETFALTGAMVASGDTLDLSALDRPSVDKHSTGGVGDKTTLAVVPVLAAGGIAVAKMSGRGLGHTGGTLDKLESIPGTRIAIEIPDILRQVADVGACLCAQTPRLVPADKKMYALRDATSTVQSRPLIASSIMSKKIAGGGKSIVLDVKVGSGAFMQTIEEARDLARLMVGIGKAHGRKVVAVLSDMNVPLGYSVGNTVEVREVVGLLTGQAGVEPRLRELVLTLAGVGFQLAGKTADLKVGRDLAEALIENGTAFETFCRIIAAQGGDVDYLRSLRDTPVPAGFDLIADRSGYVAGLDAISIGIAAMKLGAGRETKESTIDPSAGIVLRHTVGQGVERGDVVATLYSSNTIALDKVRADVLSAIVIVDAPVPKSPLILETISD